MELARSAVGPIPEPTALSAEPPTVSVIIPAFNEARVIERCLQAVRAQSYPSHLVDVAVVDNGSTDGTVAIASRLATRVLTVPGLGVGALRNQAAGSSAAAVLAFLDADCIPAPDWLEQGVASLLREPCITGATYRVPEGAGWLESAWFAQEAPGRRRVTHINAGNLFVRREDFVSVGGFDVTLVTGEDYEFAQRASRLRPIIADDAIAVVHLGNPKTIRGFVGREVWHGLGALSSVRHDWRDKPFWATIVFAFGLLALVAGGLLIPWIGPWPAGVGALAVVAVIALTLMFRLARGTPPRLAVPLAALYVLYYWGRSVALVRVAAGRTSYRRRK